MSSSPYQDMLDELKSAGSISQWKLELWRPVNNGRPIIMTVNGLLALNQATQEGAMFLSYKNAYTLDGAQPKPDFIATYKVADLNESETDYITFTTDMIHRNPPRALPSYGEMSLIREGNGAILTGEFKGVASLDKPFGQNPRLGEVITYVTFESLDLK